MSDPDSDWKPSNRPQSTIALNFMSELDSLFNLSTTSLDTLDKTINEKKQSVTTQTAQLEALDAQLRAAEERLNQATKSASSSPSSPSLRRKDSQRRTPVDDEASARDRTHQLDAGQRAQQQLGEGKTEIETEKA